MSDWDVRVSSQANQLLVKGELMPNVTDIWSNLGTPIKYPGVIQSDNTCVFVSLAGAINHLANDHLTEAPIIQHWLQEGRPDPHFRLAMNYLDVEIKRHGIQVTHFHDTDNPLQDFNKVFAALDSGAVVIPSFEVTDGNFNRVNCYHMLSIFSRLSGHSHVWDTNNKMGRISDKELQAWWDGSLPPIPYHCSAGEYLVVHDKHDLIIVERTCGSDE
ncbi:MAG: hypothetical protein SH850_29275 [Planctomycetaceae bacterium]|nr:hypothetical protein [Planctomycetaceae bacterium]